MNPLQTSLFKVGLRVFEDLGFMLPTAELDDEQANAAFEAAVSVDFCGPMKGTMLLALSGCVLSDLAANMLGEDIPATLSQQHDALKEVANVICGNLLPHIGGPAAVFELGQPRIRDVQEIGGHSLRQAAAQQAIGLESGRADLFVFLEGLSPQEQ